MIGNFMSVFIYRILKKKKKLKKKKNQKILFQRCQHIHIAKFPLNLLSENQNKIPSFLELKFKNFQNYLDLASQTF